MSIRNDNIQAIGNKFYSNVSYVGYKKGIYITDACRKNVIIRNNEFYGEIEDAIAVESGNSSPTDNRANSVSNVLIEGNILEDSRIYFKTLGKGCKILNNTIGHGVLFDGDEVIISNNTITKASLTVYESGILCSQGAGIISNNSIAHGTNGGDAIRISLTALGYMIVNNEIIKSASTNIINDQGNLSYQINNIWRKGGTWQKLLIANITPSIPIELIINGDFSLGVTGWSVYSGSWDFTNSIATLTPSVTFQTMTQNITVLPNTQYTTSFTQGVGSRLNVDTYVDTTKIASAIAITDSLPHSITTPSNCNIIKITLTNGGTMSPVTFDNISCIKQ